MKAVLAAVYTAEDGLSEAELVGVEREGDRLTLTLDDGQTIDMDVWELLAAAAQDRDVARAA